MEFLLHSFYDQPTALLWQSVHLSKFLGLEQTIRYSVSKLYSEISYSSLKGAHLLFENYRVLTLKISNELLIGFTGTTPRHGLLEKIVGKGRNKQNPYEYVF